MIQMDAPKVSYWLLAFICERNVRAVTFGSQEYQGKLLSTCRIMPVML